MGIVDMFNELISSLPFTEALAEAPPAEEAEAAADAEGTEEEPEEAEEEEGEEEEEEEEPQDMKPKFEEVIGSLMDVLDVDDYQCANSSKCAPAKHHFDECVERVTRNSEDPDFKGPHEDCVEEFFHLQHCSTQCAAPKLFRVLK
ncbi:hypothetical protein PABG_03177 [Paracoccidioides brasiliensis Pb03]|nr:hypothetical protein PABG_03177 [Paracoccidioides brasiliensis Pb03]